MPKTIGKMIRDLRKRCAMSSAELERKTGIAHSTIYYIENDQQVPGLDTLAKIAKALDCELNVQLQQRGSRPYVVTATVEVNHE